MTLRFADAQECWHALTRPLMLSGNQRGALRPAFDRLLAAQNDRGARGGAPTRATSWSPGAAPGDRRVAILCDRSCPR